MSRSALTSLIAVLCLSAPAASATASAPSSCQDTYTPVRLLPAQPTVYRIWGRLCLPAQPVNSGAVQVLISGATYNHYYWDLPVDRPQYSYVGYTTDAGYATFNIDRIGTRVITADAAYDDTMTDAEFLFPLYLFNGTTARINLPIFDAVGQYDSASAARWPPTARAPPPSPEPRSHTTRTPRSATTCCPAPDTRATWPATTACGSRPRPAG
jgi:hypothetical protein